MKKLFGLKRIVLIIVVLCAGTFLLKRFPKKEKVVNAPLANLNVSKSIYEIDALKGGEIKFSTGTRIFIPAESFTNGRGEKVKGKVKIHYREFHSPKDIFLSGITMKYKTGEAEMQLESAGMLEIKAFSGREELSLAKGKKINIEQVSNTREPNYNLYYLDTVYGGWKLKEENLVAGIIDLPSTETPKPPVPLAPQKPDYKRHRFRINETVQDLYEIKRYKGALWELDGPDQKKSMAKNPELRELYWSEVKIISYDSARLYKINLRNPYTKKSLSLIARPVYEGLAFERAQKEYSRELTAYAKRELIWKGDSIKERRILEKQLASQGMITTARRMLNIDQMGIWNSDRPILPLPFAISKLKFMTSNEEKLELNLIYIVDQSLNTVFSYDLAYDNGIRLDPAHKNFLYAVKNEKSFYIADPESFRNFNFGSNEMSFKMKELQKLEDIEAALEKIRG